MSNQGEAPSHGFPENFLDCKCPFCGATNSFPLDALPWIRQCLNCTRDLLVPEAGSEFARKIPIPITTTRLALRTFTPDDFRDWVKSCFDDEAEAARWLAESGRRKLTEPEAVFPLAMQVRESGAIRGYVGLRFTDTEFCEVELFLQAEEGGDADELALEALGGVLGFCFRDLKVHRVVGRCLSHSTRFGKVFESAGLRREGEFVKNVWSDGEWHSTIWYGMLEEEYTANSMDGPPRRPAREGVGG